MSHPLELHPKTARWLALLDAWAGETADLVARGRQQYDADRAIYYALRETMSGVGEMATHLIAAGVEQDPRHGSPPWPWHAIKARRHRTSHYGEVNPDRLWRAATEELPSTLAAIRPLLDEAGAYCEAHGVELTGLEHQSRYPLAPARQPPVLPALEWRPHEGQGSSGEGADSS